jgi:hypothetical protein
MPRSVVEQCDNLSDMGPRLYRLKQQVNRGESAANPTQTVDGNVV